MVPVAISLIGARFERSTVAFIGWFGPRGLASIVFPVIAIEGLHAAGSETDVLTATIGWTVLLSVVLHGLSAAPLARRYGQGIASIARDIPEREPADEPRPAAMHWADDALERPSRRKQGGTRLRLVADAPTCSNRGQRPRFGPARSASADDL